MEQKLKNKADILSFDTIGKTVSNRVKIIRIRQEIAVQLANITSLIEMGNKDEKGILNLRNKFMNVAKWLTEMDKLVSSEIQGLSLEHALKNE